MKSILKNRRGSGFSTMLGVIFIIFLVNGIWILLYEVWSGFYAEIYPQITDPIWQAAALQMNTIMAYMPVFLSVVALVYGTIKLTSRDQDTGVI